MISDIKSAIKDIKNGRLIIITDDKNRENEGDLYSPAQKITKQTLNFMITEGRGLVCVPITQERANDLELNLMTFNNTDNHHTNFTISVDHKTTSTGISVDDRLKTIKALVNNKSLKKDFRQPGHIFPLIAQPGGILKRAGHTEAATDLASLAGLKSAGVICEIIRKDGKMARLSDLKKFAIKHNLKIITIKDLIKYKLQNECFVEKVASSILMTSFGEFKIHIFKDNLSNQEHVALTLGKIRNKENVLVRVHSECLTGDIFHSLHCDCGIQLEKAMKKIATKKCGVILYMRQEGRGIGLTNKIKAYALQRQGLDTVEANHKLGFEDDLRDYGTGAQILKKLGLKTIHLLTNNPRKIIGLEGYGIKISKRIPIEIRTNRHNKKYLETKKKKLHHLFKDL